MMKGLIIVFKLLLNSLILCAICSQEQLLEDWLSEQFILKKGYVQQTLNNTTNNVAEFNWQLPSMDINFDKIQDFNLAVALGHARSNEKPMHVKVKVEVLSGKTIEVKMTGILTDLYDFSYGAFPSYWSTLAARTQSGYNTLGEAGRVYKSEIQLVDSLWPREFNFK
ncbi:MAG: hypothetical protein K1X66_06220 [Verrucomicrobiae bacterium]|nr:hypothetical protein [Verrucomicrobiae bacterium]